MKKKRIFTLSILGVVATAAIVALVAYRMLNAVAVVRPTDIYVATGGSYAALIDSLGGDGESIKSVKSFDRVARAAKLEEAVKPGRYVLRKGMTLRQAVQMFKRGLQSPVRLTFNNIRTSDRLAAAIARQTEPDSAAMATLFADPGFTSEWGFTPQTFIAMFIPNTYEIYWNSSPQAICERMKKEYDKFWNAERTGKLASTGLSQLEVSILASIVYEETKMSDEMPKVAGVYINRLRIGMPLQADPTVKFAVGDFSIKRVLNRHLTVDSPYNTYKHAGLPPGPICMPSIKALDAVLNYSRHDYLYFCASPDFSGYHCFAKNLAAHNANARAYAAALDRNGIKR